MSAGRRARASPYGTQLVEHEGFFYESSVLEGIKRMHSQFESREDDVFVCSGTKTGTTWLKAMVACIMGKQSDLKAKNAHEIVPQLESIYNARALTDSTTSLAQMPSPRLLGTHLPYSALPPKIRSLACKIIYIARNPKDTFVSHWKFLPALQLLFNGETSREDEEVPKEVFFDSFCNGVSLWGPFLDHVLGFWNASREVQSNILFLTYEDMKADSLSHIRKIADFLGQHSLTEEDVRYIDSQCSFRSLSTSDVNSNGKLMIMKNTSFSNREFFRKGEVGDWKNHFTPEMNSRMELAMEMKFQEAGMFFKYEL